jgi:phenylpropionate dioxygenase-like ring-hydroxylating dioxygenase large terminal subunit
VRPSAGEPIDLDAHLGGAERELAPLGLERYRRFARREIERAMNWKLVIDTFLEAYHVSSLHARSLGPAIFGAPAAWDAFGRGGRLVAARRSIADARRQPESDWNLHEHSVVLYQLFPNTMLIYQVDHVEVVQAFPGRGGADTAKIVFTLYTPSEVVDDRARRHFQSNFDLLLEVTEREDFRICEQMQRGFHVDEAATVVYGRNEPGLAHYHRMIRQALDEAGVNGGKARSCRRFVDLLIVSGVARPGVAATINKSTSHQINKSPTLLRLRINHPHVPGEMLAAGDVERGAGGPCGCG